MLKNEGMHVMYETEEEDEIENWDDWSADKDDEEGEDMDFLCLFCNSKYSSCDAILDHCLSDHCFDFRGLRNALRLDFYGCIKLINYVRSQVAKVKCWSCGLAFNSNQNMLNHLHATFEFEGNKLPWDDNNYLKPFMQDDALLHSFGEDEEDEGSIMSFDENEILQNVKNLQNASIIDDIDVEIIPPIPGTLNGELEGLAASFHNGHLNFGSHSNSSDYMRGNAKNEELVVLSDKSYEDEDARISSAEVIAKEINNVNENYFGAYSSFGIHREMLIDKVRMGAYRQAILGNSSLLNGSVVLDVGCGTGILSLFAAQAGASRVIAVEASDKMASVATKIAEDNGLLWGRNGVEGNDQHTGIINVVKGMVEELDSYVDIQPQSVDVLLSEWMGYCLLYETMVSSVLFARDRWLKPGGAILPDTASIFVAGFGRGGTSIPFWENVYGFNMSSVGKELFQDAARTPIVDVVDSHDIITNSALLQTFDLVTMKPDDVDFTSSFELEPRENAAAAGTHSRALQCYGVVLWFETGFTSRFCKEMPAILSTSPYTQKTHWSQTILTFREPIAMAVEGANCSKSGAVGCAACPASRICSRISIARASQHRCIDISLETTAVGHDGRKSGWPVQIFNMN